MAHADPDPLEPLSHHTLGAWTHAYIPPHLPETFGSRELSACCVRGVRPRRPKGSLSSLSAGSFEVQHWTVRTSVLPTVTHSIARNSRSCEATGRLEIANSAACSRSPILQLGVPKDPVTAAVLSALPCRPLDRNNVSLLPSL